MPDFFVPPNEDDLRRYIDDQFRVEIGEQQDVRMERFVDNELHAYGSRFIHVTLDGINWTTLYLTELQLYRLRTAIDGILPEWLTSKDDAAD